MKRSFISVALAAMSLFATSCCSNSVKPTIPSDPQMERKIEKILKNLTLEEKVRCLSFAEAMNAIEGLTISTELKQHLERWKNGETNFYQVFEDTLKKHGFPT